MNLQKGLVANWKFDGNAKDATPSQTDTTTVLGALGLPVRIVEEQTLTADAASITFTSIDTKVPAGSRHLVLIVSMRATEAVTLKGLDVQFNNDTAGNYHSQRLSGTESTASAARVDAQTFAEAPFIIGDSAAASAFGGGVAIIPHFANTANHKAMLAFGGAAENYVRLSASRWASTAAITEIDLLPGGSVGNFKSGSTAILGVVDERYLVAEVDRASEGTVTFDNIPQGVGDLAAVGYVRQPAVGNYGSLKAFINDDTTAANYAHQSLRGQDTAVTAFTGNDTNIGNVIGSLTANAFGAFVSLTQEYQNGVNYPHTLTFSGGHVSSSNGIAQIFSSRRSNAAAITKIEYKADDGNFSIGSFVSLYRVPRHLIKRTALTSDTATVTFDNIPQNFSSIEVSAYGRSDFADTQDGVIIEINDDATAANYDMQLLVGDATVASASQSAAYPYPINVPANSSAANLFSGGTLLFPAYAKTDRHKHYTTLSGDGGDTFGMRLQSSRWESTSAITKIELTPDGGTNFKSGSVFELWGVLPAPVNEGAVIGAATTTDRKGQSSKAYDFDGTDDYIEVQDNSTLDFGDTSDLTISGWF
ncbi:MAG: hypothetical protein Q7J73_10070, partial [Dehalococcoidales bacterium]|nr:hypothetical protein [Dehalococcoidales bacterium]